MKLPRRQTLFMYEVLWGASQVVLVIKNPPANAGDIRDVGSIPGSGRSPGGGYGNPPQYSCLENPMDRGPWRATVHGVTKSQTRLQRISTQASAFSEATKRNSKQDYNIFLKIKTLLMYFSFSTFTVQLF